MIKIFYTDIAPFYSESLQNKYFSILSSKRKMRINDAKNANYIATLYATGVLENTVFEKYGANTDLILENENFKPYFADNSLFFSISHTKSHSFIAISDKNIGFDVEKIYLSLPLAKRFFTDEEFSFIEKSDTPALDFTRIWVSKEAYTKFFGEKLANNISKISFANNITLQNGVFLSTHLLENDYCFAICSQEENKNFEIEKIFFEK